MSMQIYTGNSSTTIILLAKNHLTRTFAARAASKKRKKAAATKTKESVSEVYEKLNPLGGELGGVYPFCLPKEQPILPSSPVTIPHCRIGDEYNERYYKFQRNGVIYSFPGVTHVLSATRPSSFNFAMKNWEKNMIKEHGEEGFRKMKAQIRTQGHDFHKAVGDFFLKETKPSFQNKLQNILRSLSERVKGLFTSFSAKESNKQVKRERRVMKHLVAKLPEAEGFAKSVEYVVNDISEVYAVESVVAHVNLGYVGTVDLVAKYRGEVCVIDWKTSQKPKRKLKDIHDYPLQSVAYAGAINDDKNYSFNVTKAVIVVVYMSGAPADVHVFDHHQCIEYWREWLERLDQFQKMFAHDLNEVIDG